MTRERFIRELKPSLWGKWWLPFWQFAMLCAAADAQSTLPPGTVLVSKWHDERLNTGPGEYNHTAHVSIYGDVIESQAGMMELGGYGVIRTPWHVYYARPQRIVAFIPIDPAEGQRAAWRAEASVGRPFRPASSLLINHPPWRQALGENCITAAVETTYGPERLGCRLIVIPDGMFRPLVGRPFYQPVLVKP